MTERDPQQRRLCDELEWLVAETQKQGDQARWFARFWNSVNVFLGAPAAALAAISAITGLASTTGRVPAAYLALASAGLTATVGFIRADARYLDNWKRKNAWRVLHSDARLVLAREGSLDIEALFEAATRLFDRRAAILRQDYEEAMRRPSGAQQPSAGGGVFRSEVDPPSTPYGHHATARATTDPNHTSDTQPANAGSDPDLAPRLSEQVG